jgi:hypothetical protein
MGSFSVVKASIVSDDDAGFGNRKEDFLVEALVPKATMDTLNKSILPGTARVYVQRLHVGGNTPILNNLGDKFRAIVQTNIRRGSISQSGHPSSDPS